MAYCAHCGFEYTPKLTEAFCVNCGSRLEEPTSVSPGTMQLTRVPRSAATLVDKSRKGARQTFELARDRITIGGEPRSGVVLEHSSVSPFHAVIRVSQGRFVLYDAGSASGTRVNEEPVTGELLTDGSRILMGVTEILFSKAEPGPYSGTHGSLAVQSGPLQGKVFPIDDHYVVIGRRPGDGGLQLDDGTASQRHALVQPTPHGCMIFDLASNNGTFVDGVPLRGRPLYDGDVIRLGDVELQFAQQSGLVASEGQV